MKLFQALWRAEKIGKKSCFSLDYRRKATFTARMLHNKRWLLESTVGSENREVQISWSRRDNRRRWGSLVVPSWDVVLQWTRSSKFHLILRSNNVVQVESPSPHIRVCFSGGIKEPALQLACIHARSKQSHLRSQFMDSCYFFRHSESIADCRTWWGPIACEVVSTFGSLVVRVWSTRFRLENRMNLFL